MKDLEELRKNIDLIDEQIILLLKKRLDVVKHIGKIKIEKNLPALDKKRKNELLEINKIFADKIGLSKELIEKIFSVIHDEAVGIQNLSFRAK